MAEVLTPGDAGYPAAVSGLSVSAHRAESSPAAVLRATDRQTAAEAVRWARARGLRIRVRSGGHHLSLPAPGLEAAVLDLSALKGLDHDPATGTAWLGAGLTSLEAARGFAAVGRAFPVGHAATVGVGGFLLAGGHGWNPGGWGMAANWLTAIELITADGEAVVVDDASHPDVLELARGAGPLFGGVVTRFVVRTADPPELITRRWWRVPGRDAHRLGELLDGARTQLAPDVELTCFVHRRTGKVAVDVVATAFVAGQDQKELLSPLTELGALADESGTSDSGDLAALLAGLDPHTGEAMVSDHVWSVAHYADLLPVLVAGAAECPTTRGSVLVSTAQPEVLGSIDGLGPGFGGPGTGGPDSGPLGVAAYGHWLPGDPGCDGTDTAHRRWVRTTVDRVPASRCSYVGEADLGRDGGVERCFPSGGLDRIRTSTARHGADGLLAVNR